MDARLKPGPSGVRLDGGAGGMLQVVATFDDYQDQTPGARHRTPFVHIEYGFLMATDGKHDSETGRLDAYQRVSLTYDQLGALYLAYLERRAAQNGAAEDAAEQEGE
jgi:hypothetical protein